MQVRLNNSCHRRGMNIVELITILCLLGIILVAFILVLKPSINLNNRRYRPFKTMSRICMIDQGLEMYRSDHGQYPSSYVRPDPVINWPQSGMPDGALLYGAHWLVRALAGHDLRGIDSERKAIKGDQGDEHQRVQEQTIARLPVTKQDTERVFVMIHQ